MFGVSGLISRSASVVSYVGIGDGFDGEQRAAFADFCDGCYELVIDFFAVQFPIDF